MDESIHNSFVVPSIVRFTSTLKRLEHSVLRPRDQRPSSTAIRERPPGRPPCCREQNTARADNVLKDEALEARWRRRREHHVFASKPGPRGLPPRSICRLLLLQVAGELKAALPSLLGKHQLNAAWVFKIATTRTTAGERHQRPRRQAAVNLNLWLSASDANLEDGTTALLCIRSKHQPRWTRPAQ